MDIGKLIMPLLTTLGGVFALRLWWILEDGADRGVTALLAGFLLSRGISQLVCTWNTRHDTDNADR